MLRLLLLYILHFLSIQKWLTDPMRGGASSYKEEPLLIVFLRLKRGESRNKTCLLRFTEHRILCLAWAVSSDQPFFLLRWLTIAWWLRQVSVNSCFQFGEKDLDTSNRPDEILKFGLVGFYGISATEGNLIPNPLYTYYIEFVNA